MSRSGLRSAVAAGVALATMVSLAGCHGHPSAANTNDPKTWAAQAGELKLVSAERKAAAPANVAPDTKYVITVKIKPGIKWSDGSPLTSSDFVGLYDVKWAQQDPVWKSLTTVSAPSPTELV